MKPEIRVTLFGKFCVRFHDQVLLDHSPHKVQELLAYLVLHRGKAHPREALTELLWGDHDGPNTRKYLRQALWQLNAGLLALGRKRCSRLLHADPGWVELVLDGDIHLDTAALDSAFSGARGVRGAGLTPEAARVLLDAVPLYQGDLLEGWCQDWCRYDRDRFREVYLSILDKLVDYHEAAGEFEAGIAFGNLALQRDPARERTHRSLMRMLCFSGNRVAAIRQFERCTAVLHQELEVVPEPETLELYARIRRGNVLDPSLTPANRKLVANTAPPSLEQLGVVAASARDSRRQGKSR